MKPKILVIGLDAATMDLIEPWVSQGRLPSLAALIREGASGRLLSTPNMHSASAWTSILTGLNPGRHGLFVFSDRDFVTGRQVFFKGGDRTGELITSHLNGYGLTSGLLNVPMTYPAESRPGGFTVSGLDAPSLNAAAFSPTSLREDLLSRFPDYAFTPPALGDLMISGDLDKAIATWLKLIETQTAAALYLLESHPVDFFMTVYTASDWAGHNLWKYHDSMHPEHEPSAPRSQRESMLEIYRALDCAVGALVEQADPAGQVYVISDHGMGPHTGASYHLAEWLEQRGYLARRAGAHSGTTVIVGARNTLRRLLPASIRASLRNRLNTQTVERIKSADKDSFYSSIDWSHTTAYSEAGRHVVNINLKGRNREGIVPAEEYDGTCQRLIDDLEGWTDDKGRRVVARVMTRSETYRGPHVERASDLFVNWNAGSWVGPLPDEIRCRGYWWNGDHRPEGILISKGSGIRPGVAFDAPSVYDFLPTVMRLAGLPVPAGLDGRVIDGTQTDESLAGGRVKIEESKVDSLSTPESFSEAEEQLVEEKLRELGYL